MPHARFIETFPGSENDPAWVEREIAVGKPYSNALERFEFAIIRKAEQARRVAAKRR